MYTFFRTVSIKNHWELIPGGLLILLMALRSEGFYHPDEHFQLLEYANYKSGLALKEGLPWEFHEQIRPGLQPFIAYSLLGLFRGLGVSSPFVLAFILRLVSGLLMLGLLISAGKYLAKEYKSQKVQKVFLSLGFFLWFAAFLHVRFSSENWAALSFFSGLLILLQNHDNPGQQKIGSFLISGLLISLSFQFRYQMAFAAFGLAGWLWYQKKLNRMVISGLAGGGLIGLGIGLVADYWMYQTWQFTPYYYFFSNIVDGKAATFGIEPWWFYFTEFFTLLGPGINLVLSGLFLFGLYSSRSHSFSWVFISFLTGHVLVDHKEFRFMFPMLIPFLVMTAAGWHLLPSAIKSHGLVKTVMVIVIGINLLLLTYRIKNPAYIPIKYFHYFYQQSALNDKVLVFFYGNSNIYGFANLRITFYRPSGLAQIPISAPEEMDKFDISKTNTFLINQTPTLPFSQTKNQRLVYNYSTWQFEDLRRFDIFKPVNFGWKVYHVHSN